MITLFLREIIWIYWSSQAVAIAKVIRNIKLNTRKMELKQDELDFTTEYKKKSKVLKLMD